MEFEPKYELTVESIESGTGNSRHRIDIRSLPKTTPQLSLFQWILQQKDFSYAVIFLIGIVSWTVSHNVDRLLAQPIVKVERNIEGNLLTLTLSNISRDTNFSELEIRVFAKSRDPDSFLSVSSSSLGTGWDISASVTEIRDGVRLQFPNFHPGNRVVAKILMNEGVSPEHRVFKSVNPILLENPSIKTRLIEHEISIIFFLSVLAVGVLILGLSLSFRSGG